MSESTRHTRLVATQDFLTRIGRGDLGSAAHLLSEHVVYTVPGRNQLAGTFTGPQEVAAHLLKLADVTGRTFAAFKWDDWMVGEHHVAGLSTVHAHVEGRKYSGHHLTVVRFNAADKMEAITVFFEDQGAIDRFIGPS